MKKIICLFGMVDSGKTTIGRLLSEYISGSVFIDSHDFREFCGNYDYSEAGRVENIKRLSSMLDMIGGNSTTILAFNIPTSKMRNILKVDHDIKFIHCNCDFQELKDRDDKGLWARVGIDDSVQMPGSNLPFDSDGADLVINTENENGLTPYGNASKCAMKIMKLLDSKEEMHKVTNM